MILWRKVLDGIICLNNPLVYVDPSGHSWKSFAKSFASAFVGAVVFVATGGNLAAAELSIQFIGSCMAAGAAAGATSAALKGGYVIQGAAMGAIMGGVTGGFLGGIPGSGPYLFAAGAGYATERGGLEGLADFAGGVMGAMAGTYSASYIQEHWPGGHQFSEGYEKISTHGTPLGDRQRAILNDPVLQAQRARALRESNIGQANAREQGGWINEDEFGFWLKRWKPGEVGKPGIQPSVPPSPLTVASYHTHPFSGPVPWSPGHVWALGRPSADDRSVSSYYNNMDGFIGWSGGTVYYRGI